MIEELVVDASVVAKWFNRGEHNEEEAKVLRDAWSEGRVHLYAPDLLIYEVANSIQKNPGINTKTARSLARLLPRLSPTGLQMDEDASEETIALARRTKLTYYDAAYLVLAKSSNRVLITADNEQLSAARGYSTARHIASIRDLLKH